MAKDKISKRLKASSNSVSLAGEFAALSRLHLEGYDANMTLGTTKGVDILVFHRATGKMYQLEVKTNLDRRKTAPASRLFGRHLSSWIMHEKHESCARDNLWFCFVRIGAHDKSMRFFVVPSAEVESYVRREHQLWLQEEKSIATTRCASFGSDSRTRSIRSGHRPTRTKITGVLKRRQAWRTLRAKSRSIVQR